MTTDSRTHPSASVRVNPWPRNHRVRSILLHQEAVPTRDFPVIEPQPAIVPRRATRFNRQQSVLPLLVAIGLTSRQAETPIRPLPPSEPRSCGISAQHPPLPPSRRAGTSLLSVAASAALHQRRRHTEPLDAVSNRCGQLAWHRHVGDLERHVLRMPNHFGPYLDQLRNRRAKPALPG